MFNYGTLKLEMYLFCKTNLTHNQSPHIKLNISFGAIFPHYLGFMEIGFFLNSQDHK